MHSVRICKVCLECRTHRRPLERGTGVKIDKSRSWLAETDDLPSSEEMTRKANSGLLVVDDDRGLCQLMTQYLRPKGFSPSGAHERGEWIGNHAS
jgi:hypothetical protein